MKTLKDVEKVLKKSDSWTNIRIAYRDLERSEYTVLWPKNLKMFQVL